MKAKQRSPDEGQKKGAAEIVLLALQTSQRIIQWVVLLLVVHVLSNQIAVIINPSLSDSLTQLLEQTKEIYKLAIGGYLGKAAVENVLKIWNNIKSVDSTGTKSTENG